MSKATIDYEAMPTAEETVNWNLTSARRKLLAKIVNKPREYETFGPDASELRWLSKYGVVALAYPDKKQQEAPLWRATAAGYGLMAQPLPDYLQKEAATYFRARNWGRVDRCPTQNCANCRKDYTPVASARLDCCPACVLAALSQEQTHFTDLRFAQDGGGRVGWASTDPGKTKHHYYDASGKSQCNYQRQHGPLHFHEGPGLPHGVECCSACNLALAKEKQPRPARKAVARASKPTPPADSAQLSLF